jgi:hypothetical protein
MPNKRFKILKGALKYLRTSATDIDVTLPAGTPLRKFQDYDNNKVLINYTRSSRSLPGELVDATLTPFALPLNADSITATRVSKRVTAKAEVKALFNEGGLDDTPAVAGDERKGFIPAKCTVIIPNATLKKTNVPSQLTGKKYSTKGSESFTFPYGKSTGKLSENDVRTAIVGALNSNPTYKVNFKSERF